MDWKIDRQKRERNLEYARREAAKNLNLLEKMDNEFEKIFGRSKNSVFSPIGSKPGDPVLRSELTARNDKK